VERWFAELTNKAVRRGSFQSVPDLIDKIMEFIESHNEHAKAFVWTANFAKRSHASAGEEFRTRCEPGFPRSIARRG